MIKVNLAKRKGAVTSASVPGSIGLGRFTVDLDAVKDLPIRKAAVYLVVAVVAANFLWSWEKEQLDLASAEVAKIQQKISALNTELTKSRDLEEQKKSLEADEKLLEQKIKVIEELNASRVVTSHLMFSMATVVPKEIWLTEVKLSDAELKIKGKAFVYPPISDFLKSMTESEYFSEVTPEPSEQGTDEGREVFTFSLLGKRKTQ